MRRSTPATRVARCLNVRGELIGINTAIVSSSGGSNGVGLALPANLAKAVMQDLLSKGHVERGYLGAGLQPMSDSLQEALGAERGAAVVADIATGSPAETAGVQKGDVVVAVNGRVVHSFQRLQLCAAQAKPHSTLELTISRKGTESVIPVVLGERPLTAPGFQPEEVFTGASLADSGGGGSGPVVMAVDPQSVSAMAGLRAGDVIVAVEWKPVTGTAAVREQMAKTNGKPVLVEISRAGSTFFLGIPLP